METSQSFHTEVAAGESALLISAHEKSGANAQELVLVDRFGDLPDQAKSFYETHRLRLEMTGFGIKKIDATPASIQIQFIPNPPIDPMKIIQLIQSSKYIQLNGQDKLKVLPQKDREFEKLEQRLDAIRQILRRLNESAMLNTAQAN